MTLPSRKKLPTTVQNIHSRLRALERQARRGLLAAALIATSTSSICAQSPGWQPSRLPAAPSMQPLSAQPNTPVSSASANSANGSGVQLRWRASSRVSQATPQPAGQAPVSHVSTASAVFEQANSDASSGHGSRISDSEPTDRLANDAWLANPLRDASVQPAASQLPTTSRESTAAQANNAFQTASDNRNASTSRFAPRGAVRTAAYQPPANELPSPQQSNSSSSMSRFQPPTLPSSNVNPMPTDPLSQPELPPVPPAGSEHSHLLLPGNAPSNSLDNPQESALSNASEYQAQADRLAQPQTATQDNSSPSDKQDAVDARLEETFDQLGRPRIRPDASANCETFRDNLRKSTLDKVNLNSGPRYGQGLRVDPVEAEKMRLDFAADSEVRDWCDRHGRTLVRGRLVDLRNEQVVLDIDGARREIPLRDLCDVDLAYVGKAWNLPISCGSGNELVAGRGFVPSAMQWKASGLCHKPLYFEEVQLERYGHEIGPLLQPVVSTVHFFGNIAVLPYKMGIHPPHECQHALGYYRPGECAPYMLPPIPISLRGAAVQAGAVVGAAALIP